MVNKFLLWNMPFSWANFSNFLIDNHFISNWRLIRVTCQIITRNFFSNTFIGVNSWYTVAGPNNGALYLWDFKLNNGIFGFVIWTFDCIVVVCLNNEYALILNDPNWLHLHFHWLTRFSRQKHLTDSRFFWLVSARQLSIYSQYNSKSMKSIKLIEKTIRKSKCNEKMFLQRPEGCSREWLSIPTRVNFRK